MKKTALGKFKVVGLVLGAVVLLMVGLFGFYKSSVLVNPTGEAG